jgi:predicted ATPase
MTLKKTTVWRDIYNTGVEDEITVLYGVTKNTVRIEEVIHPDTQQVIDLPEHIKQDILTILLIDEFEVDDIGEKYE